MSKNLALTLKLDANGNLVGVLDQASQKVKTFGKTVDDSSNLTQKFYQTLESVTRLAAVGISTIGVANFAQSMAEAGKKTESFLAQLKVATGSVDNAKTAFDALNKLNTLMPESVEGITQAFIKMKNLGLEPTAQALMSFSNTAAANGKDIMQFVEAVADAATGEFERLKEFGIKAKTEGEKVSLTFRGVTTSIKNDAESITGYLQSIGENEFAGMAEAQMQTLSGAISNAEASYEGFLNAMNSATGTSETYKGVLMSLSQTLDAVNAAMAVAYGESDKVTNAFSGLVSIGKGVATTIQAIAATFEMLSTVVGFVGAAIASFGDSSVSFSNLWDAYNREIAEITNKTLKFNEALYATPKPVTIDEVAKALNPLAANTTKASTATKALTESKKELEKAAKAAEKALREELEAIADAQNLLDKYLDTDFDKQLKAIKELDTAWAKLYNNGLSNQQQFADALYAMDLEQFAEKVEVANKKMVEDSKESADAVRVAWEQSIKRLDDAFANVWEDIFSGASDFGSSLKRWFTSLLAELAHAAITKPIVISMSGALGLGGTTSAMASGGGDPFSMASNAYSLWDSFGSMSTGASGSGMMAGLQSAYYAGGNLTAANNAISGAWNSGMYAQSASTAVATYLPYAANIYGGFQKNGVAGAAVGAGQTYLLTQIGAAIGGPAGAAIAAVISMVAGDAIQNGIFGGERGERAREAFINYNPTQGASSRIESYTHYDAGWGRSGSWNTDQMLQGEAKSAIDNAINVMADSIRSSGERLGFAFTDGLNIQASIANLHGKTSEEMAAVMQQLVSEIGTKMIQGMVDSTGKPLSDFVGSVAKSGESLDQTFIRLIGNFDAFNEPIGRLNDSLSTLSTSTLGAVDSLVSMTGGMQNLAAMQSGFINAFYTDAQKSELTTQSVTRLFDSLGLAIPPTSAALVELIGTLDLTTETGQKAYTAITSSTASLKEYFDGQVKAQESFVQTQVQSASDQKTQLSASVNAQKEILKASYDARVSALNTEREAINKTVTAINALKSSLSNTYKSITQTISNPMAVYMNGQAQLFDVLSQAKVGTLPQVENVQDALTAVSQNTADYYASFEDYARDQAITSAVIAELMALSDDQLATQNNQLTSIDQQLEQMKAQYDFNVQALDHQLTALDTINQSIIGLGDKMTSSLAAAVGVKTIPAGGGGSGSASYSSLTGESVKGYVEGYGMTDIMVGQGFMDLIGQAASGYNMSAAAFDAWINPNSYQYRDWSSYVPGYASGGDHIGGIRLVGENGPEIEVTGPSRIFNAQQTQNILRSASSNTDNALIKELIAEVRALRSENAQLQTRILNENRNQARTIKKWDADGLPQAVAV